jgi:hypothetical protein
MVRLTAGLNDTLWLKGFIMRPLVLLDFDGVLNALSGAEPPAPSCWSDWSTSREDGFRLWFSRTAAASVAELGEVHWLTTWNEGNKANTLLCPLLGIGPFPVAAAPLVYPERDDLWKPRAVSAALRTGRPVIWFDDYSELLADEWRWTGEDFNVASNLFRCAPDSSVGLTLADVQRAAAWASQIARGV